MSKLKIPIIIVVVLAAIGGGLLVSGKIGSGNSPTKKYVVEPIALVSPFLVNLADPESDHYLKFNVALELEAMNEKHWTAFSGASGGGHGGGEAPGPAKVASYPKFQDAVMEVASTFRASELKTEAGKDELKKALLNRFHEIAEIDEAAYKNSASADDPEHVGPPYYVADVYFTEYIVK